MNSWSVDFNSLKQTDNARFYPRPLRERATFNTKAIRTVIPCAEIITDRFHIIKALNETLWHLNKKTYAKLDKEKREKHKTIRFLLSKSRRDLQRHEKRQIKECLHLNKEMKEIYWKVQDFRKILFGFQGYKRSFVSQKLMEWTYDVRK
jgi:transposase